MRFVLTVAAFAVANALVWAGWLRWWAPSPLALRIEAFAPGQDGEWRDGGRLSWRFNLPVGEAGAAPEHAPGSLVPAVAGDWRWSDERTLTFTAVAPPPRATRFALRLRDDLAAARGPRLAEAFAAEIRTPGLRFERAVETGSDGQRRILALDFDDEVAPGDVFSRLRLVDDDGVAVACTPFGEADGLVRPPPPQRGCRIRVITGDLSSRRVEHDNLRLHLTLAPGLVGRSGPLGLTAPEERVVLLDAGVRITQIDAVGGDGRSAPYLVLRANHDLVPAQVAKVVRLEPPLPFTLGGDWRGLRLDADFQAGQRYVVVVEAAPADAGGAVLPKPDRLPVTVPDRDPACWFVHGDGYLGARGSRTVQAQAVNLRKVLVRVERVYDSNLVAWRAASRGWQAWARPVATAEIEVPTGNNQVHDLRLDLDRILPAEARGDGVYRLSLVGAREDATVGDDDEDEGGGWRRRWYGFDDAAVVTLSDIALGARIDAEGCLAWAVSLATGAPIPGVRLRLYSTRAQALGEAVTGEDGLGRIAATPSPDEPPLVLIADRAAADGGRCELTWLDCAKATLRDPLADTAGRAWLAAGYEAFVAGDRGVYRGGETVHLRALVRAADGATPAPFPVRWRILRPDRREWRQSVATLDRDGASELTLALPDDLVHGSWSAELGLPGDEKAPLGATAFQVEDYLPDRLRVAVAFAGEGLAEAPGGARLPADRALSIAVQGDYLFGQPAAGRPATLALRLDPVAFAPKGWDGWRFGDTADARAALGAVRAGGSRVERPEADLDGQGHAAWDWEAGELPDRVSPWRLTATATVSEPGGRAASATRALTIDPQRAYLALRVPPATRPGEATTVGLALVRPDGTASEETATVSVQLLREGWNNVLTRGGGPWRYQCTRTLEPVGAAQAVALTGQGEVAVVPPSDGAWVAVARDAAGGLLASAAFYASDGGAWSDAIDRQRPERCEVLLAGDGPAGAERQPGEVLRAIVRSPFPGRLLLTVETDRVRSAQVIEMPTTAIELPLTVDAAWAPNAYVTATVVRAVAPSPTPRVQRAFGIAELRVRQDRRRALVAFDVAPRAEPGSRLPFAVSVRDALDAPLADAAVTVAAVDEGILRLTAFATPDPNQVFLARRRLAVLACDGWSALLPEPLPLGESAPGGDVGAGGRARGPVPTRRLAPAVWWSGVVRTDGDGVARGVLPIPAAFAGEIRLMAVGSAGPAAGAGEAHLKVRGALVAQASWPRCLAPGDTVRIPVSLSGETGAAGEVDLALDDAAGLLRIDDARRSVALVAGRAECVWTIHAGDGCGTAHPRLIARLAGRADQPALDEIELPVRPASPQIDVGDVAIAAPGAPAEVRVPDGFLPGSATLTVQAAPVPLLAIPRGLDALYRYPYGCAEQTVSSAFPLLALRDLAAGRWSEEGIDDRIRAGLVRLQAMQCADGGIAMWMGERAAWPWASIYAADFAVAARRAGQPVPERFLARLLAYARSVLEREADGDECRCYAAYVLAQAGVADAAALRRLAALRQDQPTIPLLLAGAWAAAGRRDLAAACVPAHLPAPRAGRRLSGDLASPVRDRALMLGLLLEVAPDHPQIARLAGELADARSWSSTQDTAFALLALGRYRRRLADLPPYAHAALRVDGSVVGETSDGGALSWKGTTAGTITLDIDGDAAARGHLEWLLSAVPLRPPPDADEGLSVRRRWCDERGKPIDRPLVLGELVRVELTVSAPAGVEGVVIEDLLPGGLEIENPSFATTAAHGAAAVEAGIGVRRVEIRDDRLVVFGDAATGEGHGPLLRHTYLARAIAGGEFALPPVRAECQYDRSLRSLNGAGRVEIAAKPRPVAGR